MLLATSVMSSVTHDHGSVHLACRSDGAPCARECSSTSMAFHGDDHGANLFAADVPCHGCLALLGTTDGSASADRPTAPHDRSQCNWCAWIGTVSVAKDVRVSLRELTLGQCLLGGLISASTDGSGESNLRGAFASCGAPFFPLCDRARHERSGVQLA